MDPRQRSVGWRSSRERFGDDTIEREVRLTIEREVGLTWKREVRLAWKRRGREDVVQVNLLDGFRIVHQERWWMRWETAEGSTERDGELLRL